ncbi:MFS transporter [Ornithinimicrobium cerasi]|uniref:Predicted arabinose efflux permease, MFS family n=1 Tax=Ornithinimicrobium cerasi TaxID=2248773 RepID=A0A285VEZ9_9MICO|nr:MFS transporter [Ornithinimicrobium cerasi]SOC52649.1 Predicted arabinose efflux permease, MFS family [Ornithinimicrobium cerasi]
MSPTQSYHQLFALTGPLYIVIAFVGRIPLAMSQIASLLAVSAATGSYTAGGATAGALAVANAVGAPVAGALTDRVGQRSVLLVQSVLGTLGLAALALLTATHTAGEAWWPLPLVAALGGAFVPQVGTMARVRWRPISRASRSQDPRVMDAAFSYEGAADEASFVLGPALVGVIAAVAAPVTSLVVAAVLLGAFGTWFAIHPTGALVGRSPRATTATRGRLLTPALLVLGATQLSIGMLFGSVQTGTSVLTTQAGNPGLTGLFHALLGVGSVLAGLAVVALPERFGYVLRLRWFTAALVLLALPLLAVDTLGGLALVLLGLGFAVAPSMITTFTLAERVTPVRRLGAAMTLLAAATGTGYAVGAALAGRLADLGGHAPAFAVTVVATVLALALALLGGRVVRRSPGAQAELADRAGSTVPDTAELEHVG